MMEELNAKVAAFNSEFTSIGRALVDKVENMVDTKQMTKMSGK